MNASSTFFPPRRRGLIFQITLSLSLVTSGSFCFISALNAELGWTFMVYILAALVCFSPVPMFVYRIYGLLNARYSLERDGIRIRWGLRSEDIPLPDIEWIRLAADLPSFSEPASALRPRSLPLPLLHWPGALIGSRTVEGLGKIEYIAADVNTLVLIATPQRIFVISPSDPQGLVRAYNRMNEMGSLMPLTPHSQYPTFLLGRIISDRWGRILLLTGLGIGLILFAWVGLAIPAHSSISLGFSPSGVPLAAGPSERLLLLPILYGLSFLCVSLVGIFFYRRPDQRILAYILWLTSLLEGLLLMGSVLAITA